ncbi:MAG: ABC transporter ATP-binding protein [Clostridia bacterium]|nr:ABC transporter ATP-binding protein [Clostridia bacterium]
MTDGQPVIEVEHLRKAYGATVAVDDISFAVGAGEIFGMVGPNGAGKTTTVECLEGLRTPDSGKATVLGQDPRHEGRALRSRIGIQLQHSALQDDIRVWEALDLYSSFYPRSVDWKSLLGQLGLAEKRNSFFSRLSGGQKQRLFIALALVNDPELVFLDELTTGLDPQSRHAAWDLVRGVRDRGKTVFITTHFMEEAERLCDRVAIVDHGRIVAMDSPANLIANSGVDTIVSFSPSGGGASFDPDLVRGVAGVVSVEISGERVTIVGHGSGLVSDVVMALSAAGVRFGDLSTKQPTLEDCFLALTGGKMRD